MLGVEEIESLDALEDSLSEQQLKTKIHNILKNETINTTSRLERLRFHPKCKSKFNIPLYKMVFQPVMRNLKKIMS
jgi:hypothetical protein